MGLYTVFLCGGMGFLLGMAYEGLRLLRTLLRPPKAAVFLGDVGYCLLCAPAVFLFLLAVADGRLRAAALVGLAAGFFACRATLGCAVTPRFCRLLRRSAKFRKLFLKKHLQPTDKV